MPDIIIFEPTDRNAPTLALNRETLEWETALALEASRFDGGIDIGDSRYL